MLQPRRVPAAIDFGDASAAAVAFAGTLARASQAALTEAALSVLRTCTHPVLFVPGDRATTE